MPATVRETKRNDSNFALIDFLYRRCEKNHIVRIYENCGELIIELKTNESRAPIDRVNGICNFRVPEYRQKTSHGTLTNDNFHAIEKYIKINDVFDSSITPLLINITVNRNAIIF